jgi:hypothetical protein
MLRCLGGRGGGLVGFWAGEGWGGGKGRVVLPVIFPTLISRIEFLKISASNNLMP